MTRPLPTAYVVLLWVTSTAILWCAATPASVAAAQAPEATSEPEQRALDLFMRAEGAYDDGRIEEAVELLVEARRLHDEPVLIYNLARAYETLGRLEEALDAYEGYLAEEPQAQDRGAIETRVQALRRQLAERQRQAQLQQLAERNAARRRQEPSGPGALPWVLGGAGVAALGTAIVFRVLANEQRDDAVSDPVHATAVSSFERAETYATTANVLWVAGAVVAAAAATWLVVESLSGSGDDGRAVEVAIGPTSIQLRGALP